MIITEGSRGSGESRVFEQRRESSPVVQSCKRVDTSEETRAGTARKKSSVKPATCGRNTLNPGVETLQPTLESNSYQFNRLLKFHCGVKCQK